MGTLSHADAQALRVWCLDALGWNIDGSNYHELARTLKTLVIVSGYSTTLSNEAALRVSLSAMQRGLCWAPEEPPPLFRNLNFYQMCLDKNVEAKNSLLLSLQLLHKFKPRI